MSVSKLFHSFLFLLFTGLTFLVYVQLTQQLTEKADQRLFVFQSYMNLPHSWPSGGPQLYSQVESQSKLQFFQFIHSTDSSANLTKGELNFVLDHPLSSLFQQELADTRTLEDGRLQLKLATDDLTLDALTQFQQACALIWAIYLTITVVFILLMMKNKRTIIYASSYVNDLSSHKYNALESSKLKAEFKPLASALENCRSELKKEMRSLQKSMSDLIKLLLKIK